MGRRTPVGSGIEWAYDSGSMGVLDGVGSKTVSMRASAGRARATATAFNAVECEMWHISHTPACISNENSSVRIDPDTQQLNLLWSQLGCCTMVSRQSSAHTESTYLAFMNPLRTHVIPSDY